MRIEQIGPLLQRLLIDIATEKCTFKQGRGVNILQCEGWAGLKGVWVTPPRPHVRITFWLKGEDERSMDITSSDLPSDLADVVLTIWTELNPDLNDLDDVVKIVSKHP